VCVVHIQNRKHTFQL